MTVFIALLRSVNVGGTGKLPMADLKAMCEQAGFAHVKTYIASGNFLFKANPFPKTDPARTVAIFLDKAPPKDTAATARGQTIEEIRLGKREIYVHYGAGMANTKLKLPATEKGTSRNINTIKKLAGLAADYQAD